MGGVAVFSRKTAISLKRGKRGPRLLLITIRKLHTRFRLVGLPKSETLDDLERHYALFQHTCIFRAYHENLNEDLHILSAAQCLVSRNTVYADIHGSSLERGVKRQWAIEIFRTFGLFVYLGNWLQHYYIVLFSPLSPFHWPRNTWPWMTLNGWMAIYVKFSLLRTRFAIIFTYLVWNLFT